MNETTRRRSPMWVRRLDSRVIHAMAIRFNHQRQSADLTAAQEWLWDSLISELEYRHRNTTPAFNRCACELCVSPFPD